MQVFVARFVVSQSLVVCCNPELSYFGSLVAGHPERISHEGSKWPSLCTNESCNSLVV